MAILNQILGTKNSGKITLVGKESGKIFDIPYINGVSLSTETQDPDYAYANGVTKKVTFTNPREGSISFNSDLYTAELLSLITGSPIQSSEVEVFKTKVFEGEELTTLILPEEATKLLGVDFVDIDGVKISSVEGASLDSDNKTITGVTVGSNKWVKAFYLTAKTDTTNMSIKDQQEIVEAYTAYIDVISTKSDNAGGGQVCLQIVAPNTKPDGSISLEFAGDSISSYEFSFTLTPDEKNTLYHYYILAES